LYLSLSLSLSLSQRDSLHKFPEFAMLVDDGVGILEHPFFKGTN
jgi:hypothetical protein